MRLKQIKLAGFKSFVDPTVVSLPGSRCAVVGPNGCGKSNVIDAVRWVLGEQKYSILRSEKMEDVIFNGADNLKPLSVCEAFLTVHNNKGKIPFEYKQKTINQQKGVWLFLR